jgi:hypothetical protein
VKQPTFPSFPKFPNNSHKLFGSYIPQICQTLPCHVQKYFINTPFLILPQLAVCEASTIYICLLALKLFMHYLLSISLPHAKIQLYLDIKSLLANFQSFWATGIFVKQVLARNIQLSWNFASIFICSNHDSPQSFNPIQSSMWAQPQILASGQIFTLWSNYILYCSVIAENLPEHSPTHITYLHQIRAHFIPPFILSYFSQILSSRMLFEGSTILVYPNGM